MGFFNSISEWKTARHEKKRTEMRSQGICPDCNGRGFNPMVLNAFFYMMPPDCPGCNGSGLFSESGEVN